MTEEIKQKLFDKKAQDALLELEKKWQPAPQDFLQALELLAF